MQRELQGTARPGSGRDRRSRPRIAAALFLQAALACGGPALAAQVVDVPQGFAVRRLDVAAPVTAPTGATHSLRVHVLFLRGGRWPPDAVAQAIAGAARLLAQCGIAVTASSLDEIDAPPRFRLFETRRSSDLVRAVAPSKPALFFVDDTRRNPAFDAEAIGRANAGDHPELADTVWITFATPHVDVALAHELVHVLSESGAHSEAVGNLMRDQTAPANVQLTPAQCERARNVGERKGLLAPQK